MGTRILAGQWRNRVVAVPPGKEVRPTTSRIRQSVLDRLMPMMPGARVFDGFAGSGVIGLECLSRGAAFVLALEKTPEHAQFIQKNLKTLEVPPTAYQLWIGTVEKRLNRGVPAEGCFQILYLDPPYGYSNLTAVCKQLLAEGWVAPHGLLLVETAKKTDLGLDTEVWGYGDTVVQVIRAAETV